MYVERRQGMRNGVENNRDPKNEFVKISRETKHHVHPPSPRGECMNSYIYQSSYM